MLRIVVDASDGVAKLTINMRWNAAVPDHVDR
jgi:hypothetical protein